MTSKNILQAFDTYLKARVTFAQQIADVATRAAHIDFLMRCGAMIHLAPLLVDPNMKVQQYAAIAIGRLVNTSMNAAQECINLNLIPQFVKGIDDRSKYFKKSAMFAIRGVAKHSPSMASTLLNNGALEGILACMEDFDPGVKESAVWAVGQIIKHSVGHAESAVTAGVVPLLKLALQEPEICLRQIAASTLGEIARHDVTLAQALIDAGCVPCLAKCILNPSPKLKTKAFCCLSNIAKHTEDMAEVVLEADVIFETVTNLASQNEPVKKAAASLICEIVKHHFQFSQLVVNSSGLEGLFQMILNSEQETIFPALLAVGFICSESHDFASIAINCEAVSVFGKILEGDSPPHVKAAAVWAVGQMGKHSSQHAAAVATSNLLLVILHVYMNATDSEDLKQKCRGTLKQIIRKCTIVEALEPFLHIAPNEILKYAVAQFTQILPHDPQARRLFVSSGLLKRLQDLEVTIGSTLMEYIDIINRCYPPEIIRYYSPGYPEALLQEVEDYLPEINSNMLPTDFDDPEDVDIVQSMNIPPKSQWETCL